MLAGCAGFGLAFFASLAWFRAWSRASSELSGFSGRGFASAFASAFPSAFASGFASGFGGSRLRGGFSVIWLGSLGGRLRVAGADASRLGCLPSLPSLPSLDFAFGDGLGRASSNPLEPVPQLRLVPGKEEVDSAQASPAPFNLGSSFREPCSPFRSFDLPRLRFSSTCPGSFGEKKASSLLELCGFFMRSSKHRH